MTTAKNDNGFLSARKRKKTVLGKGLSALIPEVEDIKTPERDFFICDIDHIRPNRYQPRMDFDPEDLAELAESVKEQGIIQPLIVRRNEDGYELVAGERRLRAAKMAALNHVPVVVKDLSDTQLLEMSIVENIQRQDLNPLEEAEAYHRLIEEFDMTQDQTARRVGKSRSAVANFLRLRHLPEQIKQSIREDKLSMGHARALLGAETTALQLAAWRAVITKNLSVRETEALIKKLKAEQKKTEKPEPDSDTIYFGNLADDLSRHLGTKVLIKRQGKKGRLEIEYYSHDDLDNLIQRLRQI